jgi:hypothetical protein
MIKDLLKSKLNDEVKIIINELLKENCNLLVDLIRYFKLKDRSIKKFLYVLRMINENHLKDVYVVFPTCAPIYDKIYMYYVNNKYIYNKIYVNHLTIFKYAEVIKSLNLAHLERLPNGGQLCSDAFLISKNKIYEIYKFF